MPYYKIRITSDTEEEGELLRQAFKSAFGDALTLSKARKGNNPKYADDPKFLAYGELELSREDLEAAAAAPAAPSAPSTKRTRAKAPATSPAKCARAKAPAAPIATQETINLSPPAKRQRKPKP